MIFWQSTFALTAYIHATPLVLNTFDSPCLIVNDYLVLFSIDILLFFNVAQCCILGLHAVL